MPFSPCDKKNANKTDHIETLVNNKKEHVMIMGRPNECLSINIWYTLTNLNFTLTNTYHVTSSTLQAREQRKSESYFWRSCDALLRTYVINHCSKWFDLKRNIYRIM